MIRAHINAVVALLEAAPVLRVGRAGPPIDTTLPYGVMFPAVPSAQSTSLGGASTFRVFRFYLNTSGITDEQIGAYLERVEARLLDVVPVVAGRMTGPIHKALDQPPSWQRDTDVPGSPLITAPDIWQFASVPA